MLKKITLILFSLLLLSGCGNTTQEISPDTAWEVYSMAVADKKHQEKQYIHNITAKAINSSPLLNMEFICDKKVTDNIDVAKIKIKDTSTGTNQELEGRLNGTTLTYIKNDQQFAENKTFDDLLREYLVYDININPEYIEKAEEALTFTKKRKIRLTLNKEISKDIINDVMPEIGGFDEFVQINNAVLEFTVDKKDNLLSLDFDMTVTMTVGEEETVYQVNVERSYKK